MLAPIATWIAIRGHVVLEDPLDLLPACTLGLAVLMWVAGFDIIYACQDVDFDTHARLHSVPVRVGVPASLAWPRRMPRGDDRRTGGSAIHSPCRRSGIGVELDLLDGDYCSSRLLVYEHAIVRPDDLTRVNVAFFRVNAVVSIGLFLVVFIDLLAA